MRPCNVWCLNLEIICGSDKPKLLKTLLHKRIEWLAEVNGQNSGLITARNNKAVIVQYDCPNLCGDDNQEKF